MMITKPLNNIREGLKGSVCYDCLRWTYWDFYTCKVHGVLRSPVITCDEKLKGRYA